MKPLILVAEDCAERGWRVTTCDTARQLAPSKIYPSKIYPAGPWRRRMEQWLRAAEPAAVRAVVLVSADSDAVEYPVTVTLMPCPVVKLPRLLALAAYAPVEWSRFAVVDSNESSRCGLVTRTGANRFFYAEGAASDSRSAAPGFGFGRAVAGGESGGSFMDVRLVSAGDRFAAGSARLAISALESDGVCLGEAAGRPVLRLALRYSTAYEVIHTDGAFDPTGNCIEDAVGGRPALFAIDLNVMRLYGRAIRNYASRRLADCQFAVVRPGDASKNWSQVAHLCERAERARLPRHGVMVGVGGGVTLDVAGMAAALYRRGVPYLRVPTTLLGMVDVAVGIKQAINFNGRKSLLGTFYPPIAAINDLGLLRTLPKRKLANGFSEIIKLGLVRDRALFEWVERYGEQLIGSGFQEPREWAQRIALRSEYVMMADLQPNLYETHFRRFPDFGHTFSSAIEEASDYLVPHGEAVAIDMLLATIIAVNRGICPEHVLDRLTSLYEVLGLLGLPPSCTADVIAAALERSRLQRGGQVHMVVPSALGEGCFVEDVTAEEAGEALERAVEVCGSPKDACYAGAGY